MTILITGGSGFIGGQLTLLLRERGHQVCWLTRKKNDQIDIPQYLWDWKKGKIESGAIENADVVIHLSGTSLSGKRWSTSYKREIYESRIVASNFLWETVSKTKNKITAIIAASAVGYYGNTISEKIFTEEDSAGKDFLAQLCFDWEASIKKFSELGIRTTILRSGVVISKNSKAYQKIILPIKYGIGAAIGSGKQYFSWIHAVDLCQLYYRATVNNGMQGVYNVVAPEFVTNEQLMKTFGDKINRRIWLPNMPSNVIKLIYGEMAETLLGGSRVSPQKIIEEGFVFNYPKVTSI